MSETLSETGLVAASSNPVTVAVTEPQLPLGTTPPPLPASFTVPAAAALARDLAINLFPEDVVIAKHGITPEQLKILNSNTFFQKLVEIATLDWNSSKSMPQRLALEAQVLVEDVMPDIGARMKVKNEPLTGVVSALSAITKIAGIGENKAPQAAGEKFTITINLGADTLKYEKSRQIEGAVEVQPQSEGDRGQPALPSFASAT